ncbi:hypothetical protein MBLNU13_g01778t1 [Cladosporium sp. NU13]
MAILEIRIRPLIEDVIRRISNRISAVSQRKTWTFGQNICTVEMNKNSWTSLLRCLKNIEDLTMERAQHVRSGVTLAPERVDYRDRHMLALTPARLLCMQRFREDGLLLPFGATRLAFSVPNPTIFQGDDWPMKDSADPLDGWNLPPRSSSRTQARRPMTSTASYTGISPSSCDLSIAACLPGRLVSASFTWTPTGSALTLRDEPGFDRIETSNIADEAYLNTPRCLALLGIMLKKPDLNPHATLLTLYMNAVDEMARAETQQAVAAEYARAEPYVFKDGRSPAVFSNPFSKERILLGASRTLFRDNDGYFDRQVLRPSPSFPPRVFPIRRMLAILAVEV